MSYLNRRLLFAFLTSVCQYILFWVIFTAYMIYIPWAPIVWVLIVPYIIIPILSAYGCCYLVNRNNFHFDSLNMASKVSVYKLIVRFLPAFCFFLIGYILGKRQAVPIFISNLLSRLGNYGDIFASALTNPSIYLIVSIFPITFAIVEYIFVVHNRDYSAES